MGTTAREARLGEWFDIFCLFTKAVEKNPLQQHASLAKIAFQIRKQIKEGFILAIDDDVENVGYLCISSGHVWWTMDYVVEEHFVLGRVPGFGRIARGWLEWFAKGKGNALIFAGNALSPDKQLTTNGYLKDGYQTSNVFYKEVE